MCVFQRGNLIELMVVSRKRGESVMPTNKQTLEFRVVLLAAYCLN
jgi:hypothetical protein